MVKIIQLCLVCGGKGRFFNQRCSSCNGQGGNLSKLNNQIKETLESNITKFNEQENELLELYKSGFSPEEIAKKSDLSLAKTLLLFYQIEKKLN